MSVMTENAEILQTKAYEQLVAGYTTSIMNPELRQILIDNLAAALDSDEKIEKFAKGSGIDPDELKRLLKKPSQ
jgi:spore coat protein CotF